MLALLAMHAGALYFLLAKAAVRGIAWQIAFLQALLWEWLAETLLIETVEITTIHFCIPRLLLHSQLTAVLCYLDEAVSQWYGSIPTMPGSMARVSVLPQPETSLRQFVGALPVLNSASSPSLCTPLLLRVVCALASGHLLSLSLSLAAMFGFAMVVVLFFELRAVLSAGVMAAMTLAVLTALIVAMFVHRWLEKTRTISMQQHQQRQRPQHRTIAVLDVEATAAASSASMTKCEGGGCSDPTTSAAAEIDCDAAVVRSGIPSAVAGQLVDLGTADGESDGTFDGESSSSASPSLLSFTSMSLSDGEANSFVFSSSLSRSSSSTKSHGSDRGDKDLGHLYLHPHRSGDHAGTNEEDEEDRSTQLLSSWGSYHDYRSDNKDDVDDDDDHDGEDDDDEIGPRRK
jgi:hypothetical protein